MRNHNRRPPDTNFIDRGEFAFDFNIDPARTVYEIALLNYEAESSVNCFDISRA